MTFATNKSFKKKLFTTGAQPGRAGGLLYRDKLTHPVWRAGFTRSCRQTSGLRGSGTGWRRRIFQYKQMNLRGKLAKVSHSHWKKILFLSEQDDNDIDQNDTDQNDIDLIDV